MGQWVKALGINVYEDCSGGSVNWEVNIPFTDQNKWVSIEVYEDSVSVDLMEIYKVQDEKARRVLGETDTRPVISGGFKIPSRVGEAILKSRGAI